MSDLGIIPINMSILKKDVPLTNIIINSKLF